MGVRIRLPHAPQAPQSFTIEAVVFDLDGLLIDSEGLAAQAWRQALATYGAMLSDAEIDAMFGMRIVDDAALLIERHGLPTTVEALVAQRGDIMRSLLRASLQPMPGAVALVRRLSEHGVPLAIATSGQRRYAEECLAAIGLESSFAVRVTGDDVTRGKPDPEVFLAAAARLGVAPPTCLALEDAPLGAAAALAAGMPVIVVPNVFTRALAFLPGVVRASSLTEVSSWMTLG
jgi:HAD superfamily hydrolase (TIGR01509 family)